MVVIAILIRVEYFVSILLKPFFSPDETSSSYSQDVSIQIDSIRYIHKDLMIAKAGEDADDVKVVISQGPILHKIGKYG